jgi:hypothetical protein
MPATAASRLTPYAQELLDNLRSSLFGSASQSEPTPEGS